MRYIDTKKSVSASPGASGRVKSVTFARSVGDLSERITLDLEGIYTGYEAGEETTLDGVRGRVIDVNLQSQGIEGEPSTTVNFRDWMSNLILKAPAQNYLYVSAPRTFWEDMKNDTDDNTEIYLKEADDFGVGGWTMKDILRSALSKVLGLNLWYSLPNFWVQQFQIQEGEPLFQNIFSGLTALDPQVTVNGNTIYVYGKASSATSSGSLSLTDAETISSQRAFVAYPSELKVTGGEGQFKETEWDGPWEGGASSAKQVYFYGKYWQVTSPGGWEEKWSVTSDNSQLTLVYQLFAKTPFGDVSHLTYQWTEVYKRWEPLAVNSIGDVENLQYNVYTSRPTLNVSPEKHKLESVEFVVNNYQNTGVEFDRPLLTTTYTERLRYLYFSADTAPAADETLYIPSGFPRTMAYEIPTEGTSADDILVDPGTKFNYAGVWTNKGSLEKTEHIYEDETYGGRLQEVVTQEWGLVFTEQVMRDENGKLGFTTNYQGGPIFFTPLKDVDRTEAVPFMLLPDKPLWRIRLEQDVYRELSYRHAQRATYRSELDPTRYLVPPYRTGQTGAYTEVFTLFKTQASLTQIPAAEVPVTWSKRRTMPIKVYQNLPGGDADMGMATVSLGLLVDWDDAYEIAEYLANSLVQGSIEVRTTVTLKGAYEVPVGTQITGSIQDAMRDFPPIDYGDDAKVEGWSKQYDGEGNATTTLTIVGYDG